MARRIVLGVIWISFVAYTLWLAPLDHTDTWSLARKLLTLRWNDLNAYIPAIFSLMGVWPMIYACLMFADGRMQPFRSWPYFVGANFTGVICLLPYLLLRQRNQDFDGQKDPLLQALDRRSTGVTLFVTAIACIVYAVAFGDWADYVQQFQTQPFVHLISIDFGLMGLIFPITSLLDDDMLRRHVYSTRLFWLIALIPLLGPLVYLCVRPPLPETQPALL
jgi:hypothetical protein